MITARLPLRIMVVVLLLVIGGVAGRERASDLLFAAKAVRVFESGLASAGTCGPMLARLSGALCGVPPPGALSSAAELSVDATVRAARFDANAIRTLAVVDLIWADTSGKSIDRAISSLHNLRAQGHRPADMLVDLAAAYVLRGDRTGSLLDYAEAVEAAAAALEMDSTIQANMNLSVALRRMHLERDAEADSAITTPAIYTGLDTQLPAWGAAVLAEQGTEAAEHLRAMRAAHHGPRDRTLPDVFDSIERASPAARMHIARAADAFGKGRALYASSRYGDALPLFEQALRASEPLASWAAAFRAACLVYVNRAGDGEAALRALSASVDGDRYPSLAGRVQWMLGTTMLRSARYEDALTAYTRAESNFERAGEREHVGAIRYLISETQFAVGDQDAAYTSSLSALRTLAPYRGSQWLHNLLLITAQRLADLDLRHAALYVQTTGVETAQHSGRATSHAEALLARGALHARSDQRRLDASRADVDAATRIIDGLPDGSIRDWLSAEMQLVDVAIQSAAGSADAAQLDPVVSFAESSDNVVRLMRALVARAGAFAEQGNIDGAVHDLNRVTQAMQTQRVAISRAALRASLADASAEVFDQLIRLHVQRGEADAALAAFRRSRGTPETIRLADADAALTITLVGDTLLFWLERDGRTRFHQVNVGRIETRDRIRRTIARLEIGDDRALVDLTALHRMIIAPLAADLAGARTLVIEADRELAGVPFAALRDPRTGRFLVEDYRLSLRLPASSRRTGTEKLAGGTVLVVADPSFDERAFPMLDRLRGAAVEATSIATAYEDAVVLAGERADRASLWRHLPDASLLHFAGHALYDARSPDQSVLVLAGRNGRGRITAAEIRTLDLSRLRLAVLSACTSVRTADGRSNFGGLASAFLDAGAEGVIGSLWRVDDPTTARLMAALHRHYAAALDAPSALRAAQLEMIRADDARLKTPAAWAGFVYATHSLQGDSR